MRLPFHESVACKSFVATLVVSGPAVKANVQPEDALASSAKPHWMRSLLVQHTCLQRIGNNFSKISLLLSWGFANKRGNVRVRAVTAYCWSVRVFAR